MLTTVMDEQAIQNLDGYLLSLRRLSGNACDFWVEIFDCTHDVECSFRDYLSDRDILVVGNSAIGYREIDEVLGREVFSKLQVRDKSLLKLFAWDIIEYLEMSYHLMEPKINPISEGAARLFTAESTQHDKYIYIVVPVFNRAVALGMASRV